MGTELARATVKIVGDITDLEAALSLAQEEMVKAGKSFEELGNTLLLKVTLPLITLGGFAVKEFGAQEDAVAKLNAVLQAAGGVTGATTKHIEELAHQLQDTTRFYDDNVMAAAAMLATFHQVRNEVGAGNDVFDRAIKASAGLASITGDLEGEVFKLGRALEDPAGSLMLLRRSGVIFTDVEKQQIKTLQEHGQVLEAQRMILEKVEGKIRTVAAAMANTPFGHFIQMWNAIKDAVKPVGSILASVLVPFADAIKRLANAFRDLPRSVQTAIVAVAALAAALGPLLILLASAAKIAVFIKAMVDLRLAWVALSMVGNGLRAMLLTLINPWVLITAAVIAVVLAFKDMPPALQMVVVALGTLTAAVLIFTNMEAITVALKAAFIGLAAAARFLRVALMTLMTPWSLVALAVMATVAAFIYEKRVMDEAAAASQQATDKIMAAFNALSPEQVQRRVDRLGVVIDDYKAKVKSLQEDMTAKITTPHIDRFGEQQGTITLPKLNPDQKKEAQDAIDAYNAQIANLNVFRDTLVALGATFGQTKKRMHDEFLAAIAQAAVDLDNATRSAEGFGKAVGPTFNVAGAKAAALEANMHTIADAAAKLGESPSQIAAHIARAADEWRAAKFDAAVFDLTTAFDNAVQSASVLGQVLGPTFTESAAVASAFRAKIDAVVKAMQDAKRSTEDITAATLELGKAWQLADLNAHLDEAVRGLDNANKMATVSRRIFGGMFNLAGAQAQALRAYIDQVAGSMIAAGATIDQVVEKLKGLGDQVYELEKKAAIGDFFQSEMSKALDAVVDFTFGAKQSFADFLREVLSDIAKFLLKLLLMKTIMDLVFPGVSKGGISSAPDVVGVDGGTVGGAAGGVAADVVGTTAAPVGLTSADVVGAGPTAAPVGPKPTVVVEAPATAAPVGLTSADVVGAPAPVGPKPTVVVGAPAPVGPKPADVVGAGVSAVADRIDGALDVVAKHIDAFMGQHIKNLTGAGAVPVGVAAKGGTFSAGAAVLVGEAGPELVNAGRRGMTVTPLSAASASAAETGGGAGTKVEVNVNVQAIDSRDVAQFFDDNNGLVAGAVSKAVSRSMALARKMGRN